MYTQKYINKNFWLVVMLLSLSSCTDYLDIVPDNIATIDDAFDDVNSAERYLFTCYSWMPNLSDLEANPTFYGGDEAYRNLIFPSGAFGNGYKFDAQAIAIGNQNALTPIADYWSGANGGINLHRGIRDCNTFLENIDQVSIIEPAIKKRWIAEVKFLKAYYHFFLFRMYGPIIISDFNLPIDADISLIQKSRSTVDECATYISDLFLEASEDLPLIIDDRVNDLGRATKLAALALRARMLTYVASPLYNGNGDYANVTNNDGTNLFPQTYDNEKWRIAAEACKLAINTIEEAGVELYRFQAADLEKIPSGLSAEEVPEEVVNMLTIQQSLSERWTDEKLFVSTKGSTNILQQHAMARTYSGVGGTVWNTRGSYSVYSPTLRIAEMFYTKRGVPIDEDKDWDYGTRYDIKQYKISEDEDFDGNGVEDNSYYIRNNETTANLNFDRETRFYGSLGFDRGIWFTSIAANGTGLSAFQAHYIKARNLNSEWSSALSSERDVGSQTGYFAKKLTNYKNTNTKNTNGTELNSVTYPFPEIRLADLYLLYAECLNEIDERTEAYIYIDKVRERANLEGVVASWTKYSSKPDKPNTKAGLREIIQQERMIELVFEGQRFWDLRRWKLAENYLNTPFKGWNFLGKTAEEYYESPRTLAIPEYSFKHNLWPIDTDEILSNPNTVQNGGW